MAGIYPKERLPSKCTVIHSGTDDDIDGITRSPVLRHEASAFGKAETRAIDRLHIRGGTRAPLRLVSVCLGLKGFLIHKPRN